MGQKEIIDRDTYRKNQENEPRGAYKVHSPVRR